MRVLFINPIGSIGGGERVLVDCISSLLAVGPSIEINLIALESGPLVELATKLGAKVKVLPAPPRLARVGDSAVNSGGRRIKVLASLILAVPGVWKYVRSLRREIEAIQADVIHSNGLKTHLLLALTRYRKAPIIWHIHDFIGTRPIAARLLQMFSPGTLPVAISAAVANDVKSWHRGSPPSVLLNAVDLERFSPANADPALLDTLLSRPTTTDKKIRVGLVATYAKWKGQDIFLRAAAAVLALAGAEQVEFYVIGGPIYKTAGSQWSRAELQSLAKTLGISDRVRFIDFQNDTAEIYRALDIVVHASIRPEPFGLTIVEAMACGRPVIVSAAGGAIELFTDGQDAIGVSPNDVDGLKRAIQKLIKDPDLRTQLGAAARQSALKRFNRDRLGPQLLSIYKQSHAFPSQSHSSTGIETIRA